MSRLESDPMDQETAIPPEEEISVEQSNVIQPAVAEQDNTVNNGTNSFSSSSSDSSEEEESEEVESRNRRLLEAHPIKRKGLSKYYDWGSKSFNNLKDALGCRNIQEITKKETTGIRQRKRIRMLTAILDMERVSPSDD